MAKKIIEFEGFADQNPGWEFDMPVYMVKPMLMYGEDGNARGFDNLVEEYLINLSLGRLNDGLYNPIDDSEKKWIARTFSNAKKGLSRKDVLYMRRLCEIDDENDAFGVDLESENLVGNRNKISKKRESA